MFRLQRLVPFALVEQITCQRRERESDRCLALAAVVDNRCKRCARRGSTKRRIGPTAIGKSDRHRCSRTQAGYLAARVGGVSRYAPH